MSIYLIWIRSKVYIYSRSSLDTSKLFINLGIVPAAIVGCAPLVDRNGQPFTLSEEEIADVVAQSLLDPLEPLEDTKVVIILHSVFYFYHNSFSIMHGGT